MILILDSDLSRATVPVKVTLPYQGSRSISFSRYQARGKLNQVSIKLMHVRPFPPSILFQGLKFVHSLSTHDQMPIPC